MEFEQHYTIRKFHVQITSNTKNKMKEREKKKIHFSSAINSLPLYYDAIAHNTMIQLEHWDNICES